MCPVVRARMIASDRLAICSLLSMLKAGLRTVFSLIASCLAMRWLLHPWAISSRWALIRTPESSSLRVASS